MHVINKSERLKLVEENSFFANRIAAALITCGMLWRKSENA